MSRPAPQRCRARARALQHTTLPIGELFAYDVALSALRSNGTAPPALPSTQRKLTRAPRARPPPSGDSARHPLRAPLKTPRRRDTAAARRASSTRMSRASSAALQASVVGCARPAPANSSPTPPSALAFPTPPVPASESAPPRARKSSATGRIADPTIPAASPRSPPRTPPRSQSPAPQHEILGLTAIGAGSGTASACLRKGRGTRGGSSPRWRRSLPDWQAAGVGSAGNARLRWFPLRAIGVARDRPRRAGSSPARRSRECTRNSPCSAPGRRVESCKLRSGRRSR
ncbi:hypothetical protein B0H15DRAFT_861677 [Mycena belliarum]|uniref:Uncharacterized protein n=1 Tax=Mycena belliarum TaxID=1033014 RepID=A0AAD6TTS9_9AGAR|nr:hypothetical protein B0H15DRAFT_861677 [Mycena belliae]